jgi:tetratricopeptide (TPR) repeat protein
MGDSAIQCDCRIDSADLERDVEAMLSTGGESGGTMGTAGPRGVQRPRRVDDPPELPPEKREAALREAGVDPRFFAEGPKLGQLVIGSALAMKQKRGADAVRMQREARDLCVRLEMYQAAVICQIGLASYLSGLGHIPRAIEELEGARQMAREHGLPVQESQALLALGLIHTVGKRLPDAVKAYAQAGRVAEAGEMPLIAIEAWRLAGQLVMNERHAEQASSAFKEAIRIASKAEPNVVKASSAPEAARALAVTCRKMGMAAQADSLEASAKSMEEKGMVSISEQDHRERAKETR